MKKESKPQKISRLKRIINNNRRLLLYIAVVLVIFLYFIIKMLPTPSVFISSEKTSFSTPAKVYVFKDEEYVIINSSTPINFICTEGDKVSASTVLSDNYTVSTNVYLNKKLEVLDFVLANPSITTKEQIYALIAENNAQSSVLDAQIKEATASGDADKTKELANRREEVQEQLYILKRAMQYVYNSSYDNSAIRDNVASMLGRADIPLTLDNLDFSVFGNIYYSVDGFESAMNFDCLNNISVENLNALDAMSPVKTKADGKYYIKSTAGDRAVLLLRVEADTYIADEEAVNSYYSKLLDRYEMQNEGGYINFIFRRVDILNNFPDFSVKTEDGATYDGCIVQVITTDDNDKIIVLAVRDNVVSLSDKRIFSANALTETFWCYSLPNSCIYSYSGKTYVNVITNANTLTPTEVTVYKTQGSTTYLKTSDNPKLKSGDEIALKGKQK